LQEIRANRIVSRKRKPIKQATVAGYQAAVNWLNPIIGELPLSEIKNEVAKQLITKMRPVLSDKTTVNYFQVVRAVVASAVNPEGELVHPRNWNLQFIGLPVVDAGQQKKPTLTITQIEKVISRAKGRYHTLCCWLAPE